jgi:hypothetical protein
VNPADERFKHFVGRRVTVPMSGGRTIPVIADDYVDMEFGTGALKITPGVFEICPFRGFSGRVEPLSQIKWKAAAKTGD